MVEPSSKRERTDRRVGCLPEATFFKPRGIPVRQLEIIEVSINELEAMRLCDMIGIGQVEAARRMGVSRRTFWLHLKAARRKIIDALLNGKAIMIDGGRYVLDDGGRLIPDDDEKIREK
jgi:hypothetical protein